MSNRRAKYEKLVYFNFIKWLYNDQNQRHCLGREYRAVFASNIQSMDANFSVTKPGEGHFGMGGGSALVFNFHSDKMEAKKNELDSFNPLHYSLYRLFPKHHSDISEYIPVNRTNFTQFSFFQEARFLNELAAGIHSHPGQILFLY